MKYELNAYAKQSDVTIKFFENAEPTRVDAPHFHVTCKTAFGLGDFDAHFKCYDTAVECFKATVLKYKIKEVFISDDYMAWLTATPDYDEEPTREEEYYDACLASEYGDESLMERYNRKYGIEKEYSPTTPWNAPGMCVGDFI